MVIAGIIKIHVKHIKYMHVYILKDIKTHINIQAHTSTYKHI